MMKNVVDLVIKIMDENWGWRGKQNPSGHNVRSDDNNDLNLPDLIF